MIIEFTSNKDRKLFESESKLNKKYGSEMVSKIKTRLSELSAADCLEDLRNLPGPRLHQHTRKKGEEKATLTVDLKHPQRLYLEATETPEPELPGGGLDWTKVTSITIKGVGDPHG